MRRKHVGELGAARWIQQTSGAKRAAEYMRSLGWSLEAALFNLLRIARRN